MRAMSFRSSKNSMVVASQVPEVPRKEYFSSMRGICMSRVGSWIPMSLPCFSRTVKSKRMPALISEALWRPIWTIIFLSEP